MNSELLKIVPTKASSLKKEIVSELEFKVVIYDSQKLKQPFEKNSNKTEKEMQLKKNCGQENELKNKDNKNDSKLNIKNIRHEVMKFGVSGFETKNKKKAEIGLAVKLGAVPPKKIYKNYKDLLEEKKLAIKYRKEKSRLRQLGKNQAGAAAVKFRKPKFDKKSNIEGISKHYGVINSKIERKK